nr:AAA family ATPase [uncultured Vibrio sp.]
MLVEIENIGLFEDAQIDIQGLCVIAGVNDTGKSTLGKIVYSIIQGIKRHEIELEEHKEERISSVTDEVFFLVRRVTLGDKNRRELEMSFFPPEFTRAIQEDPQSAIMYRIKMLEEILADSDDLRHIKVAIQRLYHLLATVTQRESKIESIKKSIASAFLSEFEGQFCSKFTDRPSKIKILENNQELISITFQNDKIIDLSVNHDLIFSDAILIDTPVVMQLSKLIKGCSTKYSTAGYVMPSSVPLHWKDLNNKLINSRYIFDLDETFWFSKLIGGEVSYDQEAETFQYKRIVDRNEFDVRAINIASGIKSVSILNLLLGSGQISTRTLIVIDEPEVNLHPEWQVEYAKVIADLVRVGVTVIITTHSPYMIDAFKTFDSTDDLDANFYLTRKCERGFSKMHDYTHRVHEIIESLSAPLDKLHEQAFVNRNMFDD